MKAFSALIVIALIFSLTIGALVAIRDADPGLRAARAAEAQARASEAQARADVAHARAEADIAQAPVRAEAITWAMVGVMGTSLLAIAGCTVALILSAMSHARLIYPQASTGLYPAIVEGGRTYTLLNEPRAQALVALAAASPRRPTAAMVGRVLDAPTTPALPEPAPQIAAPASYPTRVDVYSAPMPQRLALPVGIDGAGRQVALPLRGLGNVVVGGLPNYGKSELLGSMAAGLLRQDATGERSQIAVIDMKLVSFGNLPNLAALRWPVATDIDEAHEIIAAVRAECQRRYELLRSAGARTLEEYEQRSGERLPYVTVLVDEIADLTCDDDRSRAQRFVASALDVTRKGRAAGLGLVLATQRPSVDVLPSSLRNLAGAAVAFRVSRNHDSMAVLGEAGAETLPAVPGRCLVKRAEVIQCQAYACGLEGGRFDVFVASLPRQLPQPINAIPVHNWHTTSPVASVVDGSGGCEPVVQRLEPGREPSPQLAAQLRQLHAAGWSKTSLCTAAWGYKDGAVWSILDRVLAGLL